MNANPALRSAPAEKTFSITESDKTFLTFFREEKF